MPLEYLRMQATTKEIGFRQHLAFFDDFEESIEFDGAGTGTDWEISWDKGRQMRGAAAMSMKTRATTPAAGDVVTATRDLAFRGANQIIVSPSFNFLSDALTAYVYIIFNIYTGTFLLNPAIRYDIANDQWQYRDSAGAWQNITDASQDLDPTSYHTAAIALDLTNTNYILAGADGQEWTLTDVDFQVAANVTGRHMECVITAETAGATRTEILIDDILLLRDLSAV